MSHSSCWTSFWLACWTIMPLQQGRPLTHQALSCDLAACADHVVAAAALWYH